MTQAKAKFGVVLPTLTSTFDLASSAAKDAEKMDSHPSGVLTISSLNLNFTDFSTLNPIRLSSSKHGPH